MYAIVEIAGQQFKVEKGRKLYVHRLQGDEGSSLSLDRVLLTDNDGQVNVGSPVVKGATVTATILKHLRDDKVIVFKKRRRKGYQVQNGHRQYLTQIQIDEINANPKKTNTNPTKERSRLSQHRSLNETTATGGKTLRRSGCQSGQHPRPPARYCAQPGRQCRHRQGPHTLCADRRRSDVPQET